jgi:predicted dithiol-disulfide oxidoreductase (DUF899 family)
MAITSLVRFPGESAEYRDARDKLLAAEIELRARKTTYSSRTQPLR